MGGSYQFQPVPGVYDQDAATFMFYYATGITPAMFNNYVGIGSKYVLAFVYADNKPLDGSKNYKLHLPQHIPAKEFWFIVVYDNLTRSELQTGQQFPTAGSERKGFVMNDDTSADVYFGPTAPAVHESNWVQTIPGKGWNTILRLYGPLQPWYDKTWKPGEIEIVK